MKTLPFKTIADATLIFAIMSYIAIFCVLTVVNFGLWGTLGIVLYAISLIGILSILSSLSRIVFLYQSPDDRTWKQMVLLLVALIPLGAGLVEMLF
jgi:hypothetical protein